MIEPESAVLLQCCWGEIMPYSRSTPFPFYTKWYVVAYLVKTKWGEEAVRGSTPPT